MSENKQKHRKQAPTYNHNKDANLPEILARKEEVKREINANIVKPSEIVSLRNSKTAVKRAKFEYKTQITPHFTS